MKKTNIFALLIVALLIVFIFVSCEPISVSINSKGDIAFVRNEGVFFFNPKTNKLNLIDWNFGKETIPVIIRWSPAETSLAFTVKKDKNAQETEVFLSDLTGKKNKIYSTDKIITQLEWSPDSKYISLAQQGQDTDMGVVDIVLINVGDGMSKVITANTGDIHRWVDNGVILLMKITEKNKNNSDILKGELSTYDLKTQVLEKKINAIVSKTGGLDYLASKKEAIFSAIDVKNGPLEFVENMKSDVFAYTYNFSTSAVEKISENIITFLKYSPDGTKILIKTKDPNDYSGAVNLAYFTPQTKKVTIILNNVTDTVSANSQSVQVYPSWFDNNSVVYFNQINTYGSNGQALQMMNINITSMKKVNYQPWIDLEVYKLVEAKGGY